MRDATDWHMHYPKPGDRFCELEATFVEVVALSDEGMLVLEVLPERRHRLFSSTAKFRDAYRRKSAPGYMVRYKGNFKEQ